MKNVLAGVLIAAGAALMLWDLGRPALWNDEAETALRAESVLETGLPRTSLRGVRVTAQSSLERFEGTASGVWTWNTWLPAYLAAASIALLGPTPFAARLPFALAGALTLLLAWRLFEDGEKDELEDRRPGAPLAALALLALSPAFLLFARQSRYYALIALGVVLVLRAWRRLLEGGRWGVPALVLSLQLLLHSSFAFFAGAALGLLLDAALRFDECPRQRRFWAAALWTAALSIPALWYFHAWDRPGNHLYGWREAPAFLKTFLLWLAAFAAPLTLLAAASARRWLRVMLGFVLLCGLTSEGRASEAAALLAWLGLLLAAGAEPAPYGVMNLRRCALLIAAATLAVLSWKAAEPYGRYLAGLLPLAAYLTARAASRLAGGRAWALAALTAAAAAGNLLHVAPLKAAQALAAPAAPAESVSGMMRQRLRDLPLRSELRLFLRELAAGPEGYVETAARVMRERGGETFFSDEDALSLMFASRLRPLYEDELAAREPDWLLLSPWLRLRPELDGRLRALAASGRYEAVPVEAPRLMWQNNPDPLYRDFAPRRGPLALLRRVPDGR